ncbi:MAG: 4-hydroxybenzoate octaprenyltransferase [Kiloniellales bacterium]|nr:4-hydroxybenzoate octaprenyltransferase [Kiloniellales bacterium]
MKLARIDRPIGVWLLLYPCWCSYAMALKATSNLAIANLNDLWLALLFAVGAFVMRAAGCTINDIADRDIDAKVARTALRPLPSGQISLLQAFVFLGLLLIAGLVVLLQFNSFTIWLGVSSLVLVASYPFMKRFTYWPQAWLGLTFNWGMLMGWSAVTGSLSAPAYLLYAAGIFWTLGYDTIYAHQDKEDDAFAGVKSTALRLGSKTKPWLFAFYGLTVLFLGAAGLSVSFNWIYFTGLGVIALHFCWQILSLNIDDPKGCLMRFKSNRHIGLILLIAIVMTGFHVA